LIESVQHGSMILVSQYYTFFIVLVFIVGNRTHGASVHVTQNSALRTRSLNLHTST